MKLTALATILSTALFLPGSAVQASDVKQSPKAEGSPYRAVCEVKGGSVITRYRLLSDGPRFRREDLDPSAPPSTAPPRSITIYNGLRPAVLWLYSPEHRVAQFNITDDVIALAARKYGDTEARRIYQFPPGMPLATGPHTSQPRPEQVQWERDLPAWRWKRLRTEAVAGFECDVFEGELNPPERPGRSTGANDASAGTPSVTMRAYVERRSRLVLKLERRSGFGRSPIPPQATSFRILSLRFERSLSRKLFDLPVGASARVPAILRNMPLPAGVRRVVVPDGE